MNRLQICFGLVIAAVVWTAGALSAADRATPVTLTPELRQRCLEVLRAGVKADEFWPSMHAAEGLTLAGGGDEVQRELRPKVEQEADEQKRCGLARELVRAGDRRYLRILFETLGNANSNGRIHAAESLYKLAEIGDGRLMRQLLLEPHDPRLTLMVAAALARCGNREALTPIRTILAKDDREPRHIAAWILGLLGDQSDVPRLTQIVAIEEHPLSKAYAVHALACLGDSVGREALGKNMTSADGSVRPYAAEFAGYSRAIEYRDGLVKLLDDPVLDVRVRAAQSLVALSLPPERLGLPISVLKNFAVELYPATAENPRYSEGSIITLRGGGVLYATTEFIGGGADHATARIIGRTSHDDGHTWSEPRVLQSNVGKQNVMSVTLRRMPQQKDGSRPVAMFYLVKNSPSDLQVYLRFSNDETATFGEPILVTNGSGYHVMNNDRVTILSNGRMVCPVAWAADVFKQGHFVSFCYLSDDGGRTWQAGADKVDQPKRGAMEPEVVELTDGRLMMIVRNQVGSIATSYSSDGGNHWSEPSKLPVAAPEAPATIRRIPATGDLLLIWNNTFQSGAGHGGKRTPLSAAVSKDDGKTWSLPHNLETSTEHQYAYVSVLFHKDRALLGYYVSDDKTGRISSRFRSLPVGWFYAGDAK